VVAGAFRAHCGRKTPDHFVGSGLASRRMQARQREQSCGLLWLLRYWRKPQTHKHAVPVPHKCCSSAVDLAAWGNQKKSQNYCCVVNWVLLSRGTVVLSLEGTDEHLVYRPRLVFIPPAPGMSHLQSTLWTSLAVCECLFSTRRVSILVLGPILTKWNKNWNKFELRLDNFTPIFIPTFGGPKYSRACLPSVSRFNRQV
jgi:hypothetical protein